MSHSDGFSEAGAVDAEHLEADLRVEALAERVHMSSRNFARVFMQTRGRTPARAVEAIRIDAARRRLEETAERITTIADDCGFTGENKCDVHSSGRWVCRRKTVGTDLVRLHINFRLSQPRVFGATSDARLKLKSSISRVAHARRI